MISQDTLKPLARNYRYDGLNRLRSQNVDFVHNTAFSPTQNWQTSYTYDLMGNITTLKRNAGQQQPMDRFGYNYYPSSNKLAWVSDSVPTNDFNHDIDNQQSANYTYDAVGNLSKDMQAEIAVNWNDYGKVKDIRYLLPGNPLKLAFTYDAMASRLTKTFYDSHTTLPLYTDVYVRDPQGNPIATYKIRHDSLFLDELYIYGSQRIGVSKENRFLAKKTITLPGQFSIQKPISLPLPYPQPLPQPLTTYTKHYELTDWLGNVRVVITNKKIPLQSAPLRYKPDVVSVTDYYAFGSEVEERTYEKANYKYGFNGQIEDNEITGIEGSHLAFEYRIYDSRLGKFLSVDQLAKKYPQWSSYQFAGNQVIRSRELEGLEPDIDLNAQATATVTLGGESGTSHFNVGFSVGASTRNSFGQVGINAALNITNGGLGSPNGKNGRIRSSLALSPSLTFGGGTTQTKAPLFTISSNYSTSVTNNFSGSITHAQNFMFSSEGSQRVGAWGLKAGDVSLNIYNDNKLFLGDKEDRWWSGGGNATISNFLGNSANSITFGNDVFTGNSYNKGDFAKYDMNEPTYSYNGGVLNYANQSRFDMPRKQGYNQSLNMGQTFFRLNTNAGTFQISHSGNWDMFSQDKIHDVQDFHRFHSTVANQFNISVGK